MKGLLPHLVLYRLVIARVRLERSLWEQIRLFPHQNVRKYIPRSLPKVIGMRRPLVSSMLLGTAATFSGDV